MSVLDGIIKPTDLAKRIKELDMRAVGITDHGVASGAIQHYKECKKQEINPIIGIEFYLSPTDNHIFKEALNYCPKQQCYHLTALAKNADGVSQIYELSSRGFLEGFYYKPRVSLPMIEEIGKDLIIMGACAKGPVSWNILEDNMPAAKEWLERLKSAFEGRFYLELMDHGLDWQKSLNTVLEAFSSKYDVPWVPTNDAHFLLKEDHYEHSLMMCLQLKQTLDSLTMRYPEGCYVKTAEEMIELFGKENCKRTLEIAEQINIELNLDQTFFPEYSEE